MIIGHGILYPTLRDELYCQLCRQLTRNADDASVRLGWMLLSLCVGCIPPSERFENHLRAFLATAPSGWGLYCEERLNRTRLNGARTQPPSWRELQCSKTKKPLVVAVTPAAGGPALELAVDAATLVGELTKRVAANLGLEEDVEAFTIGIRAPAAGPSTQPELLHDQLGHLLDAVARVEHGFAARVKSATLLFVRAAATPRNTLWIAARAAALTHREIVAAVRSGILPPPASGPDEGNARMMELAAQHHYICNAHEVGGGDPS